MIGYLEKYFRRKGVVELWKTKGTKHAPEVKNDNWNGSNQDSDPYNGKVRLKFTFSESEYNTHIVFTNIQIQPGCCGVLVIHDPDSYDVPYKYFALAMNAIHDTVWEQAADQEWGKCLLATTVTDQRHFIRWLKESEFVPVVKSKNPRTENTVTVWLKDLDPAKTPPVDFLSSAEITELLRPSPKVGV